jgi:hypothetical protein
MLVLLITIHANFHDDWFRHSSNIKAITSIWEAITLVLLMRGIHEVHRSDMLTWHDVYIKFHYERLWHSNNIRIITSAVWRSRDSSVGIATGYELDDWGVGVLVPVQSRIFSSSDRLDRLWGPPNLLSSRYWGLNGRGVKSDHSS